MPPHTNTFVGSARPELTPCAKSKKSVDDRKRTYLQVLQKNEAIEELKVRVGLRSFTWMTSFDPSLLDPR